MVNKNYNKGVKLERELVNNARNDACIAFRSAGSHSPIDVCIIDPSEQLVTFVQCKTGKLAKGKLTEIERKFLELTQKDWKVEFELEHRE